jgi:hypothetical protein
VQFFDPMDSSLVDVILNSFSSEHDLFFQRSAAIGFGVSQSEARLRLPCLRTASVDSASVGCTWRGPPFCAAVTISGVPQTSARTREPSERR